MRGGAGAAAGDVQARATCCCGRRAVAGDVLRSWCRRCPGMLEREGMRERMHACLPAARPSYVRRTSAVDPPERWKKTKHRKKK